MTIIEMIDEIDRLVSNNGTISQIKPFIITLREQAEAIEARIRTLESKSKVKRLEGENDFLRTELDSALKQIQELEGGKQGAHESDRSEVETKILKMLSAGHGPTAEQVARYIGQSEEAAKYHLNELQKIEFVKWQSDGIWEEIQWSLDQAGRGYLIQRNLLT